MAFSSLRILFGAGIVLSDARGVFGGGYLASGARTNIIDFIARAGLIAQPLSIDSLIEPLQ